MDVTKVTFQTTRLNGSSPENNSQGVICLCVFADRQGVCCRSCSAPVIGNSSAELLKEKGKAERICRRYHSSVRRRYWGVSSTGSCCCTSCDRMRLARVFKNKNQWEIRRCGTYDGATCTSRKDSILDSSSLRLREGVDARLAVLLSSPQGQVGLVILFLSRDLGLGLNRSRSDWACRANKARACDPGQRKVV
jgi:hypothetical protein